jgi:ABC-type multidrug transport system ATPase subunit
VSAREPVLAAHAVARSFGGQVALRATDLELYAGEVVALLGPNGAGKSTLLAILAGSLEPSEGRIERHGAKVGWVPQRPAFYGRLSPRENLELFARLEDEPDPGGVATRLLAQFDLPDEPRPSSELSVGNRQRLNVAIGLLGDPRVLLLDEPTASLDPGQRRRLWERVGVSRDAGAAVCFATQNLEELEAFADRVAVLQAGSLIFEGSYAEYEATPAADVFA